MTRPSRTPGSSRPAEAGQAGFSRESHWRAPGWPPPAGAKRRLSGERKRVTPGDLIRDLREAKRLTRTQLARKVGSSWSAIARIEDATRSATKLRSTW